jgi:hypothetical protein
VNKGSLLSDALRDELKDIVREVIREELAKQRPNGEEKLLDPKQAAELLSVSVDYLYHNAKRLPFSRKLGEDGKKKLLRFSYPAMVRWMETKKLT